MHSRPESLSAEPDQAEALSASALQDVVCDLAAQPGMGFTRAQVRRLYHQAGGPEDMYGVVQGERWRDGLAASFLRAAAACAEATWLVFDGYADSPILEGTHMVRALPCLLKWISARHTRGLGRGCNRALTAAAPCACRPRGHPQRASARQLRRPQHLRGMPLSTDWRMAQVHDDTSLLCLPNTERVRLDPRSVRILLEGPDMKGASPGLLSRMRCVTLPPLKRQWMCARPPGRTLDPSACAQPAPARQAVRIRACWA